MTPTILFDMDGVIVHSEGLWDALEPEYLRTMVGTAIADQMIGKLRGSGVKMIYDLAVSLGYRGNYEDFYAGYDRLARERVYKEGALTDGMDDLLGTLAATGCKLGLVSMSPVSWITIVLRRLKHGNAFQFIESVNAHPELKPKPAPDGYLAAMKALSATPTATMIIEDSQTGINAAVASGAHVCCFALHGQGSLPHGMDTVAITIQELSQACDTFIASVQKAGR